MMRRSAILLLLLLSLALTGCSDGNSSAPAEDEAHPEAAWEKNQESSPSPPAENEGHAVDWLQTHPAEALAAPGFANCVACHGAELEGSADIPGCYSCHSFNTTPPFTIHPASWTDPYFNHRGYAAANGTASCSNCHDLGSPAVPSCSSASFDGRRCHENGPGQVPHPLDGSFLSGANHGPVAKADLTICQGCHGQAGGPGSNPRFNIGIDSVNGTGCEGCHGINYAHPADFVYTSSHASAGNIENSCTLCHGVNLDGVGGVGVSCYSCHSFNTTPPLTIHPADWTDPYINHRGYAAINGTASCSQCHGADLHGSPAAPGCFSASFDGRRCHADGPGQGASSPGRQLSEWRESWSRCQG